MLRVVGQFVLPVIETYATLSLELMTLDITTPSVYTVQGVPVQVEGVAQIKVKGNDVSIVTAAEQSLYKTQAQIAQIALQTLEGHLRAIIGTMNVGRYCNKQRRICIKSTRSFCWRLSKYGSHCSFFCY